jgi:hypothetical protein
VDIRRDGDGDKYSPVAENGDGDGKYFGGRGAGKLPLLIPRPVDIPTCISLCSHFQNASEHDAFTNVVSYFVRLCVCKL